MKVRTGFVTNSSSTSYTLIVNNKKEKGYFNLVDMLMMYQIGSKLTEITPEGTLKFSQQPDKRYFEISSIDNYIVNTQYQIEWKMERVRELEKGLEKLNNFLTMPDDVIIMSSKWDNIDDAKQALILQISHKKNEFDKLDKEVQKMRDNCRLLKDHKGKGYVVIFTEIDHYGSGALIQAIEDGGAIVINKEVS